MLLSGYHKPRNTGSQHVYPSSRAWPVHLEAATQTFAILAKRGSGKTYTALVMVEEMKGPANGCR